MKTLGFSETIAASDLRQMDLMKICEYWFKRIYFEFIIYVYIQ